LYLYQGNKDTIPIFHSNESQKLVHFPDYGLVFASQEYLCKGGDHQLQFHFLVMNKILLAGISLLLLASCNKEVSELAPATQTGANTFGAKVDGVMWEPKGFGPFPASNLLEARFNTPTSLVINARNFASSPNESSFEIYVSGVTGPGTYLLNNNVTLPYSYQSVGYGYYAKTRLTPQDEWLTSTVYTGSVTITKFDQHERIIAGTFEFTAGSINSLSQPIHVTEGRFDIRLQ
jgi:Family of unknown function (DUF6252)